MYTLSLQSGTRLETKMANTANNTPAPESHMVGSDETLMDALKEACGVIDMLQGKLQAANVPCGEMDEILLSRAFSKIGAAISKIEGRA
jgi:hypothetical protein